MRPDAHDQACSQPGSTRCRKYSRAISRCLKLFVFPAEKEWPRHDRNHAPEIPAAWL